MNQDTFELAFEYRFEAAHRLTLSCAESCATPHGHTWYAQAVFEAPAQGLGEADMVIEFSRLKRGWKTFLQETVDHSFMHHESDSILPALQQHIPKFRGLPFPGDPTTELIAALFFEKVRAMLRVLPESERPRPLSVLIRETPTNSVKFNSRQSESAWIGRLNAQYDGWWQSADPHARHLSKRIKIEDP